MYRIAAGAFSRQHQKGCSMHSPKSRLYRSIDLAAAAEEIRRAVSRQREGRFVPRSPSIAPAQERNIFDIRTYDREIAARQIVQGPPPKGSRKKHPEDLG
jgi:hypothetical protein